MTRCYITGVGRDKPGIVAAITEVITRHHGNIEDSTMTILGSQFACILIVSFPDAALSSDAIRRDFMAVEQQLGLIVFMETLKADEPSRTVPVEENTHIISVAGHDRTGITYEITKILAKYQVNITDLNAKTIDGEDGPVYIMMVEAAMPKDIDYSVFERELAMMGENLNVEITYHPVEQVAL